VKGKEVEVGSIVASELSEGKRARVFGGRSVFRG